MAEKPIEFSGEEVRAVLDGKKTQTRQIIKNAPLEDMGKIYVKDYAPRTLDRNGEEFAGKPIFGAYNDFGDWACEFPYGKIGSQSWVKETYLFGGKPQGGCLYRVKITGVRVERLQEITDDDAVKEGMPAFFKNNFSEHLCDPFPSDSFADFWKRIHGDTSWENNHYVWVIDFEKI